MRAMSKRPFLRSETGTDFGTVPSSAIFSAASVSISSQILNRFSGSKICRHFWAGVAGDHDFPYVLWFAG
jgi:hypothetical protein